MRLAFVTSRLRVEERLADLWAAIEEIEQPAPILAQIEQLLDDRDFEGLSRLAELSRRAREQATELHARARLGLALLEEGDPANAQLQLERALELRPDRLDLRRALAEAYEDAGRERDAIPLLRALLDEDRDATPDARGRLALRLAELLRESGRAEQAAALGEAVTSGLINAVMIVVMVCVMAAAHTQLARFEAKPAAGEDLEA